MSSVKNVYILLSRPNTFISRLIAFFTSAEFSHVSVAYDSELKTLCSFARKYPFFPIPGGLVLENEFGVLRKPLRNAPCLLLKASVSDDVFESVRAKIDKMLSERDKYRYSLLGLFFCRLGIAVSRRNHYFCSQFAAEILAHAGVCGLPKPPSLMLPHDFLGIPNLTCIYRGLSDGFFTQTSGGSLCRYSVM